MRYATIEVSTKVAGFEVKWQAEAPLLETLNELDAAAGSPDKAIDWANGHISTDAGNAGRPIVRNVTIPAGVTPGSEEFWAIVNPAISKAQSASKNYSPQGARAPGVKAKAAAMDDLVSRLKRGEKVSDDYLEQLATQYGA